MSVIRMAPGHRRREGADMRPDDEADAPAEVRRGA